MNAAVGLVLGGVLIALGVAIAANVRGFGQRLMWLSLYTGAPPWKRDPRPAADRVEWHRQVFGCSLTFIGLVVVLSAVSPYL